MRDTPHLIGLFVVSCATKNESSREQTKVVPTVRALKVSFCRFNTTRHLLLLLLLMLLHQSVRSILMMTPCISKSTSRLSWRFSSFGSMDGRTNRSHPFPAGRRYPANRSKAGQCRTSLAYQTSRRRRKVADVCTSEVGGNPFGRVVSRRPSSNDAPLSSDSILNLQCFCHLTRAATAETARYLAEDLAAIGSPIDVRWSLHRSAY